LIKVSNNYERLNHFNNLTLKQKKEAISDHSENVSNLEHINLKPIASSDFANKLSELLDEKKNEKRDEFNYLENSEENIYSPQKIMATKFIDMVKNSMPGYPLNFPKIKQGASIQKGPMLILQKKQNNLK
jgi:hypothetical protein